MMVVAVSRSVPSDANVLTGLRSRLQVWDEMIADCNERTGTSRALIGR